MHAPHRHRCRRSFPLSLSHRIYTHTYSIRAMFKKKKFIAHAIGTYLNMYNTRAIDREMGSITRADS